GGLDAAKYFWRSGREKCFSLDIPFYRTSERFLGLIDSSPIPPSSSLLAFPFQLRPLCSTGITRLLCSYGPLRHPKRPSLPLTRCQLTAETITARASRVAAIPLCLHAVATTPAGLMEPIRSYCSASVGLPLLAVGRLLHYTFRGLLSVYSRYGLHARQVAYATLYTRGSDD